MRVTYARQSSVNLLQFNDVATTARWTRNTSQSFVITVNLNTRKTSLKINGVAVAGAQDIPFVSGATNLHRVQAEFTGIDSG